MRMRFTDIRKRHDHIWKGAPLLTASEHSTGTAASGGVFEKHCCLVLRVEGTSVDVDPANCDRLDTTKVCQSHSTRCQGPHVQSVDQAFHVLLIRATDHVCVQFAKKVLHSEVCWPPHERFATRSKMCKEVLSQPVGSLADTI